VFSYELLMWLVRAGACQPEIGCADQRGGSTRHLPRIRWIGRAHLSARTLAARHGISRRQAGRVVAMVAREADDHY
jgi:hypothetical protein